jgi:methylglutaconyl-CoA hydratase
MSIVEYSVNDRIARITLNRPDKRNALSAEMVTALTTAFSNAEEDEKVKAIILKANGEAFCAGADLAYLQQMQDFSVEENRKDSNQLKELYLKIYRHSKVVIAQVQGHALAGGCGLATVCDFSFAVPEAKFGYTEVKIGFLPALVTVFLLRKIGESKARELLLTGELIVAEKAHALGMINRVVPASSLEAEVITFCELLVKSNSGNSMKLTKHMIAEVQHKTLDEALSYAAEMNVQARSSEDCVRGIAAFLKKEKISW